MTPAENTNTDTIPLATTNVDDEVELVSIEGGRNIQRRLAELGLINGVQFRILSKGQPGPFIILLRQTRLVLGRGMIDSVSVRPVT